MNEYRLIRVASGDTALQGVLSNLTKMYCYEWSQYLGTDPDEKGEYIFEKFLPGYWTKPERKAFLLECVYASGKTAWAGFALIDRDFILHKDYDYSMAEFFVMHVHRRHGAGKFMATSLFDMFPGKWELGRNPDNLPSVPFWNKVVSEYTSGNFELVTSCPEHRFSSGTLGDVLSFDSGKARDDKH